MGVNSNFINRYRSNLRCRSKNDNGVLKNVTVICFQATVTFVLSYCDFLRSETSSNSPFARQHCANTAFKFIRRRKRACKQLLSINPRTCLHKIHNNVVIRLRYLKIVFAYTVITHELQYYLHRYMINQHYVFFYYYY